MPSHPDFARRMAIACDGNKKVPPLNFGRLGWFVKQFHERFNESVTVETIRKWFAGESRPRTKALSHLAEILEVDEAWLAVGKSPEIPEKAKKVRNAAADGAVNLVAGMIQICGGHPAFPSDDDETAAQQKIDLYAVIKGAQYRFHVVLAQQMPDGLRFSVPVEATESAFVIGVLRVGDLSFKLFELDRERIEAVGTRRAEAIMVPASAEADFTEIKTFANRL